MEIKNQKGLTFELNNKPKKGPSIKNDGPNFFATFSFDKGFLKIYIS